MVDFELCATGFASAQLTHGQKNTGSASRTLRTVKRRTSPDRPPRTSARLAALLFDAFCILFAVPLTLQHRRSAVRHLRQGDDVLRDLIAAVGPFALKLQRNRFRALLRAIVAQQISVAAARTIMTRLGELVGTHNPDAELICRFAVDELRAAGLSRQKASYVLDLAEKTRDGAVRLNRMGRLGDEQVIAELTQIKGIGRWSAQMFLIFSLGRLDVLPHDDLGVRSAIRNLYGLDDLPRRDECETIAQPWRPYASVASWYLWRSLELKREA